MKKVLFIIIGVLIIPKVVAQKARVGLKGGLNVASTTLTINTDNIRSLERLNTSFIEGLNIGLFTDFKISKSIAIQTELLFSLQGARSDALINEYLIIRTWELNYINIPVMIKVYASDKFSFQAGSQLGFLTSAKDNYTNNVRGYSSTTYNVKQNYNTVDVAFNFGLGFDVSNNFLIDARYSIGLTDLEKINLAISILSPTQNRVFSINLGYKFK